jgi:hypothetical protein
VLATCWSTDASVHVPTRLAGADVTGRWAVSDCATHKTPKTRVKVVDRLVIRSLLLTSDF